MTMLKKLTEQSPHNLSNYSHVAALSAGTFITGYFYLLVLETWWAPDLQSKGNQGCNPL